MNADPENEKKSTITTLVIEPGKRPYRKEIENELHSLQQSVGGYIEAVYPFTDPVAIVCCEEGKLDGMPLNRALRDDQGQIYDVVAGTFLIVGLTEDDFGSLSDTLLQKYSNLFYTPEEFYQINGHLVVLPVEPDEKIIDPGSLSEKIRNASSQSGAPSAQPFEKPKAAEPEL